MFSINLQETVEILLRHQADVNARDKNWQTPLHVAAANNAVKCADYLIPLLTNVNVSDRAGRTSLHHASFNGHSEVCYLFLIKKGLFVLEHAYGINFNLASPIVSGCL